MASFAELYSRAFRDFVIDAVPASGPNKPSKAEIRALGAALDLAIAAAAIGDLEVAAAFLQDYVDAATVAQAAAEAARIAAEAAAAKVKNRVRSRPGPTKFELEDGNRRVWFRVTRTFIDHPYIRAIVASIPKGAGLAVTKVRPGPTKFELLDGSKRA